MTIATGVVSLLAAAPPAGAQTSPACGSVPYTILGPTSGHDTTGTEGDDVILAPLYLDSVVSGLGGNDLICLSTAIDFDGSDYTEVDVDAGPGDDTVHNFSYLNPTPWTPLHVELGSGADSFVGTSYDEMVFGANDTGNGGSEDDTEVDVIDTGAGDDTVVSGTNSMTSPNHDVIATGAGRDTVVYAGMAGGTIDNGPDPDDLVLRGGWTGRLDIDNVARRAALGGLTMLSWTAVDGFFLRPGPGDLVSFAGGDVGEHVELVGPPGFPESGAAPVRTGGGDDEVVLRRYLPTLLDLGEGRDSLEYRCRRTIIGMDHLASCTTPQDGSVAITELHGLEVLRVFGRERVDASGTPRADTIEAFGRVVSVDGGNGGDRIDVGSRAVVRAGRGDDRVMGSGGVTLIGGRGDDVLRGASGRDRLLGGPGRDVANGGMGTDLCVAEVRIACERR